MPTKNSFSILSVILLRKKKRQVLIQTHITSPKQGVPSYPCVTLYLWLLWVRIGNWTTPLLLPTCRPGPAHQTTCVSSAQPPPPSRSHHLWNLHRWAKPSPSHWSQVLITAPPLARPSLSPPSFDISIPRQEDTTEQGPGSSSTGTTGGQRHSGSSRPV